MKVCFETFGCRLNKAEALQMEAEYLAKGWELTEAHKDADLFVVRGCSVTARAQHESEKMISHLKRHYPTVPVRICGCLQAALNNKKPPLTALALDHPNSRAIASALPVRTARAYLKVQDGCNGRCTFCIVPKFRGQSTSMPFTELLARARRFISSGYREIVVTGCNLVLYASEGHGLPELLSALAELHPECRIRLGSLMPGACALETIHAMAEHANICRFLHIPVQSGSNRILMAMKRSYMTRDVDALISNAVKLMPGLGLGCDLMTGFPDESDLDFNATKGLLDRFQFSNAHIFPYSERPGTPAATFGGGLPQELRSKRAHDLSHLAKRIRRRYARSFVGKTVEIIVEDPEKCIGWTGEYLRCEAVGHAPRKAAVRVFVTGISSDRLRGRLV